MRLGTVLEAENLLMVKSDVITERARALGKLRSLPVIPGLNLEAGRSFLLHRFERHFGNVLVLSNQWLLGEFVVVWGVRPNILSDNFIRLLQQLLDVVRILADVHPDLPFATDVATLNYDLHFLLSALFSVRFCWGRNHMRLRSPTTGLKFTIESSVATREIKLDARKPPRCTKAPSA